ncbi:MAG: amidohydrolase family protein [Lachnospiraceae bacterium]|nr:amidohydrolase family protein [Lachnospiraceae bacterium]
MKDFALKGDILYSKSLNEVSQHENSYLVCVNGKSEGVYKKLPAKYKGIKVYDYTSRLIIPGLVDMHLHAPQYIFIGLHMDMKLLDWLNAYTFPAEAKYKDLSFAKKAYDIFVNDLTLTSTTRFSMFATIHNEATLYLMNELEKKGFKGYVGKVNMDRNSPKYLIETTAKSVKNTLEWLDACEDFKNVRPILTPRFIPSCTDKLMKELSNIMKNFNLPVQSHLSENQSEIKWVKKLMPKVKSYEEAYDKYDMLGTDTQSIMAHYVWPDEKGIELMKNRNVWVAHSPSSNRNLSSGIAPIGRYLREGIKVGLATDVAGGSYLSMFRAIEDAITTSKIRNCLFDPEYYNITIEQALYLATLGGGEFFGKVGSFEKGYEFDAIVLNERDIPTVLMSELNLLERFERYIYRSHTNVQAKFIAGRKIV